MNERTDRTMQPSAPPSGEGRGASARLGLAWALVGVPLAYGVYQTLVKASSLFGG